MPGPRLSFLLLLTVAGIVLEQPAAAGPRASAPDPTSTPSTPAPSSAAAGPSAPKNAESTSPERGASEAAPGVDSPSASALDPTPPAPSPEQAAGTSERPSADVESLQRDYEELRDDLFKARARVSIVGSKLFHSKIILEVRSNLERFYDVTNVTLTVDGAPVVFLERGLGPPRTPLFEIFAAPGSHEIGISAELVARRDRAYKVTVHQTFGIVVPDRSTISTRLVMRETGNMWGFTKRRRGRYSMRIDLHARAKKDKNRPRSRSPSDKKRKP